MKRNRAITILAVVLVVTSAVLAYVAARQAQRETEYRKSEMHDLLRSECRRLAVLCQEQMQQTVSRISNELRETIPDGGGISTFLLREPLVRDVFIADRNGNVFAPEPGDEFFQVYHALLRDRESAWSSTPNGEESRQPSPESVSVSAADPFRTRFQSLVENRDRGWIPWYGQNGFHPIAWAASQDGPGDRIIGARIDATALLARLVPLFQLPEHGSFRIALADGVLGTVCVSGFRSDEDSRPVPADVEIVVCESLAPGWRILGWIDPHRFDGNAGVVANLLLVGCLILVLAGGGLFLFLQIRREMTIAGQKTTFVANVSHELKTPLTSIRMYSELLLDGADRITPEKRRRYLSIILDESERLSRLIANVLDFSRLEAGEKTYSPQRIRLDELVDSVADAFEQPLREAGMSLSRTVPQEPVFVRIDRDTLIQTLQNLIANAMKYAANGKAIELALEKPDQQTALLQIRDRGPGIPIHARKKIFQKFYRIDDRLSAPTRGSGLGLAISRGLMRDQGADVTFEPRPGGGSIFTITMRISSDE
jgi:signal transduction histidine kinase